MNANTAALTTAGGSQVITSDYILLALVNQKLALREADRLGIKISDDELDRAISRAMENDLIGRLVSREGGVEAFRLRLGTKLRFDKVRDVVTADAGPSEGAVRSYFDAHRSDYPMLAYEDVRFEIATTLTQEARTDAWRRWLAHQRACAAITVVDTTLTLPPEALLAVCG